MIKTLLGFSHVDILLQPTPAVTFRTVGGVLDFYFFLGPTPADVIDQYTDLVGRPYMPPYWSLGFHLCRFGYKSLNNTRAVLENNLKAGVFIVSFRAFVGVCGAELLVETGHPME